MTERANSGVRNLRAMFENQNAASSPEPRGRSPAGSGIDDINRPTSKVRASFVSVEPSIAAKDLGTTKGVSINSPQAQRRESFSVSEGSTDVAPADLKKVVSEEKEQREKSIVVEETIPEQAVETRESSRAPPVIRQPPDDMPNLGSIMKGSDFPETEVGQPPQPKIEECKIEEPIVQPATEDHASTEAENNVGKPSNVSAPVEAEGKVPDEPQDDVSPKPSDSKSEAALVGVQASSSTISQSRLADTEALPKTPKITKSKPESNSTPSTSGKPATRKPAAISTKAPVATASSTKATLPKSPGVGRMPKTPTGNVAKPAIGASTTKSPAAVKTQAKAAAPKETIKPIAPKTSRGSLRPSSTTASTTASTAAKAKAPATEAKKPAATKTATPAPAPKDATSTSPGSFKKPKPRSPTRPVRLPSHLTAPTASSAAKHGEETVEQKVARKPSAVSKSAPKAVAPAAKKQPSRASLTPSTAAMKRSDSRASTRGGADEGFLARMMRPTASSANKTQEKPASPPRRGTSARATAKPKTSESLVAKGKKKAEEVVSKAKEVVTNGDGEEKPGLVGLHTGASTSGEHAGAEKPAVEPDHTTAEETTGEAPATEHSESITADAQAPTIEA